MTILPVMKTIWESNFVDKASSSLIGCLVDILRTVLEGNEEQGAFKRGDKQPAPRKAPFKIYNIHADKIGYLVARGFDTDIASEALYRCLNVQSSAQEYCQALKNILGFSRDPIPDYDQEPARRSAAPTPQSSDSGATQPDPNSTSPPDETARAYDLGNFDREVVNTILAQTGNPIRTNDQEQQQDSTMEGADPQSAAGAEAAEAAVDGITQGQNTAPTNDPPPPVPRVPSAAEMETMSVERLREIMNGMVGGNALPQQDPLPQEPSNSSPPVSNVPRDVDETSQKSIVTLDDLNEQRNGIRENLIARALDVLNIHDSITFELADLIKATALKAGDAKTMRKDMGDTLVQSLISLQNDDLRSSGRKIASCANLLALVLQERDFYEATLDQLTDSFEEILGFIKIHPDQPAEEPSPWIGQILLVIEKMLAEDVQPSQIKWDTAMEEKASGPLIDLGPLLVRLEHKIQLFEAISDILLKIGKDESLALSAIRILVILTRNREIASRLSEKRNIQRLFVMIKQLGGIVNDKLPGTFMLLLRHVVEDEDTIRQIMRSEVLSRFETRPGRAPTTDTAAYVKQMYDLVIRSPQIFVEITNEKLEISKYDGSGGGSVRTQILQLKPEPKSDSVADEDSEKRASEIGPKAAEDAAIDESKQPNEEDTAKTKAPEAKAPVVEHPSGIIHYLLQELLTYKDVEDKEPPSAAKELSLGSSNEVDSGANATSNASSAHPNGPSTSSDTYPTDTRKAEQPKFKPSEHPIHVYRNFILQCLAELLHCYNRSKIEFINFSRKADPKAMTPSKPRSGVLNYLLNEVIPVGTLGHVDTIAFKKKSVTANWAMSAIVSLCLRTNEHGHHIKQGSVGEEDGTDLLFVRKFVLEHALKAFKDANASDEHQDVKYARLLDLADLFNRLLQGRLLPFNNTSPSGPEFGSQKSIAKLMFEKNFIGALTASIADIDLNFPGSKRAIKYILRPLRQLTQTAVALSQTSDISTTPGQTTDDDEISSATSVSDAGDAREETPDLFRNSTLGMFEPRRGEESSSESSDGDEDMYEDDYDEEMGYEEGIDRDDDDVISDEDEDLGEAGHLEGLPGDTAMDVEVVIDDDDDDDDDDPSDDDDEDQNDSEDMDEDNHIEVIDEITGDSENASLAGDEDGWQDEDAEDGERYDEEDALNDDGFNQDQDAEAAVRNIVRNLAGEEAGLEHMEVLDDEQAEGLDRLVNDVNSGRYMDDMVHNDEDDGKFQNACRTV